MGFMYSCSITYLTNAKRTCAQKLTDDMLTTMSLEISLQSHSRTVVLKSSCDVHHDCHEEMNVGLNIKYQK